MPQQEVVIRITGKDQASGSLRKVQQSVNDLGQSAKRNQASVDGLFGGLGRFATAGGIVLLGRQAVMAASNLEELSSKAKFVFKDTLSVVQRSVTGIASEVGRADSAIMQMSADIGAVLEPMVGMSRETANMSTSISKLAVDMASFHNSTDAEAFIALRSAITGETEPMKRFGVVMTQTNIAAFALRNGITQKIQSMNQAQLTLLRYNFLMEATKTVQGDAARTADGFANQLKRLQGNVRALFETIGSSTLPQLSKALTYANDFLQNFFIPSIETAIESWGRLTSAVTGTAQGISGGAAGLFDKIPGVGGLMERVQVLNQLQKEQKGLIESEKRLADTSEVELNRTIDEYNKKFGTAKEITALGTETMKMAGTEAKNLAEQVDEAGRAFGGGSGTGGAAEDAEELQEAIDDLKDSYADAASDIERDIRHLEFNHAESMLAMEDSIKGVKAQMIDLRATYEKSMEGLFGQEASAAVSQFEKVAELQERIKRSMAEQGALSMDQVVSVLRNRTGKGELSFDEERNFGLNSGNARLVNDVVALQKEQEALVKYLSEHASVDDRTATDLRSTDSSRFTSAVNRIFESNPHLAKAQNFAGLTDFEQRVSEFDERYQSETDEYSKRYSQYEEEIAKIEEKKAIEQEAYRIHRDDLETTKVTMQEFHDTYIANLDNVEGVTKKRVGQLKQHLSELQGVISEIDALMQSKAAFTQGAPTLTEEVKRSATTTVQSDLDRYRSDNPLESNSTSVLEARKRQEELLAKRGAKRYANGGIAYGPTLGLVAEAGLPEAMVPLPDGRTIPVTLTGAGASTTTITIGEVHVHNEADEDRFMAKLARTIEMQRRT
jgi:hypothetical protein